MNTLENHILLHWDIAEKIRTVFNYHTYLYLIVARRYGNTHNYTNRLQNTQNYQTQIKGHLDSNLITTVDRQECEKNYIPLTNFYYRNNTDDIKKYIMRPIGRGGGTAMYKKPRNLRQEEYDIFDIVITGYETLLNDIKNITYTKYRLDEVNRYVTKILKTLNDIQPNIIVVDDTYTFKTDKYIYDR